MFTRLAVFVLTLCLPLTLASAGVSLYESTEAGLGQPLDAPEYAARSDRVMTGADTSATALTRSIVLEILAQVLTYAAILVVLILVVAGVRLILAHGNTEAVQAAQKHVLYALLGLIVITLSLAIVSNIIKVVGTTLDAGAAG